MQKKKSLGQHFLHAQAHLSAVADAVHIQEGDMVVEVGPGEGALTAELLAHGAHVLAVEKDARLIEFLRAKFAGQNFEVIEGDALEFDISNYISSTQPFKVVGNVPYYITGALFKKFLSGTPQPTKLVFLVQKEVAERIVGNPEQRRGARSKKESILSLSVKAYGTPLYIRKVPAGAFSPPPKVDSAIIAVEGVSRDNFTDAAHEERFFAMVKQAFSQKRKTLRNTLGIDSSERAEDIPLTKWLDWSRSS
jgi:16S rRNA (adenine1518-N6/adenine1519-N6)-dimethyltransferase